MNIRVGGYQQNQIPACHWCDLVEMHVPSAAKQSVNWSEQEQAHHN